MPTTDSTTLNLSALPFYQWEATPEPSFGEQMDVGITLDSILPPRDMPDTLFRKSIFYRHSLQVQHQDLQPRTDSHTSPWIFSILLLLSTLLCLYYKLRKIKLKSILHATINRRALDRLIRDYNLSRKFIMIPMGMLVCATLALVIYLAALQDRGLGTYLLLAIAMMVAYLLRNGLFRLLANTFENKPAMDAYIANNYIYHLVLASILAALLYPLAYLPGGENATLTVIAIVVGLTFTMRFLRGIKLFLTLSSGSRFSLFYYLCIVELIPVLVLIKWL